MPLNPPRRSSIRSLFGSSSIRMSYPSGQIGEALQLISDSSAMVGRRPCGVSLSTTRGSIWDNAWLFLLRRGQSVERAGPRAEPSCPGGTGAAPAPHRLGPFQCLHQSNQTGSSNTTKGPRMLLSDVGSRSGASRECSRCRKTWCLASAEVVATPQTPQRAPYVGGLKPGELSHTLKWEAISF
jgi:hypothetical protein